MTTVPRYDAIVNLSTAEIITLACIAGGLALLVGGYMVFTRRKGWM